MDAGASARHDTVNWGHIGADVVQYGGVDKRYDIVREEGEERPAARTLTKDPERTAMPLEHAPM